MAVRFDGTEMAVRCETAAAGWLAVGRSAVHLKKVRRRRSDEEQGRV